MTYDDIVNKAFADAWAGVKLAPRVKGNPKATAQVTHATNEKQKAELRFLRAWAPVVRSVVAHYRRGDQTAAVEVLPEGAEVLKRHYQKSIASLYGFDYRDYKAYSPDDEVSFAAVTAMSTEIDILVKRRIVENMGSIKSTMDKWVARVTQLAAENGMSQREAEILLTNYLYNQRLTIGLTETQWIIEAGRKTAVVAVEDPLGNSVRTLAELIKGGQTNEALRLFRQIDKLAKLPVSLSQGELIDTLSDARSSFVGPYGQALALARVEDAAQEAEGKKEKLWQMFGLNTRPAHVEANGQVVPVEQTFSVDGYDLMYPGDGSFGAGLETLVNCHCIAVFL